MKRIFISPSRYIQGENELYNIGACIKEFSNKALLVASIADQERIKDYLDKILEDKELEIIFGQFSEECTTEEINRMADLAKDRSCDVIIGLGGGKAIDTAKAAAFYLKKPLIVVPTIAATDAPTSKLSIIYTNDGIVKEYLFLQKNPDIVLVDTGIIAKAPARYLVSGMGDALSTFFEARACIRSFADNIPGGKSTKAAFAIACECYRILMKEAVKAKAACEENVVTQSLEDIVEANILLSGLGFESSGLAAAHSVHDGLTILEETHHYLHGEKVAFGTIVHLVLENSPKKELEQVISFCRNIGLPTCLKDLGVTEITREKIMAVAKASCAEGEPMHNMPFPVAPEDVYSAILVADRLGRH